MTATPDVPAVRVRLAASLDLKAAAPLARELLDARGSDLTLEAGEVRRLGGQCLQVLLSARQSWDRDGQSFAILDPSTAFLEAATLMGASESLGLANPPEISACV